MKSLRPRIVVINSTAGAADFTTANQIMSWLGLPVGRYLDANTDETFVKAAVTEVVRIRTIVVGGSPTNGTNYQFTLTQTTPRSQMAAGQLRQKKSWFFSVTAPATGAITTTTVALQISNAINALTDFGPVAAASVATVTVTGDANGGDWNVQCTVAGTAITLASTQTYVAAVGDYKYCTNIVGAAVADMGATTDVYTHIRILHARRGVPHLTLETKQNEQVDFLINQTQDATDTAALILRITRALQGSNAAGNAIDQEELAVV